MFKIFTFNLLNTIILLMMSMVCISKMEANQSKNLMVARGGGGGRGANHETERVRPQLEHGPERNIERRNDANLSDSHYLNKRALNNEASDLNAGSAIETEDNGILPNNDDNGTINNSYSPM